MSQSSVIGLLYWLKSGTKVCPILSQMVFDYFLLKRVGQKKVCFFSLSQLCPTFVPLVKPLG